MKSYRRIKVFLILQSLRCKINMMMLVQWYENWINENPCHFLSRRKGMNYRIWPLLYFHAIIALCFTLSTVLDKKIVSFSTVLCKKKDGEWAHEEEENKEGEEEEERWGRRGGTKGKGGCVHFMDSLELLLYPIKRTIMQI